MFKGENSVQLSSWYLVLAAVAGSAHAFSLAWPVSYASSFDLSFSVTEVVPLWWLQVIALASQAALLVKVKERCSGKTSKKKWISGALLGWTFSTAWLACTFWWTFIALHTYGGLPAVLGVVSVVSLAGLLSLYYALVCGFYVFMPARSPHFNSFVFASLWLFAELARGVWFTGFGWGAAGYAHVDGPFAAYAPWVGAYGLCFIVAWLAMTLAQRLPVGVASSLRRRTTAIKVLAVACVVGLPYGLDRIGEARSMSAGRFGVTLLQGNIPQNEKFEPGSGVPLALKWYEEQLRNSKTSLVVAPETSIPLLPQQLAPDYWAGLQARFFGGEQAALIGMPLGDFEAGYTNSVVGLKPGQTQPWRYDKHHLVPFGEFIPPLFKWFTELMNIPLGDFNRGGLRQAPFEWRGQRLAANICYENLFGEELAQQFVDPLQAPTIFVNVSNLAWFGKSVAMDQHLQIARMRALEFERPFLLATNTGVTAIVDHRGHVVSSMPRNTRGVLVGEVEGRSGITPFAAWVSRLGLWPYWLLAMIGAGLAVRSVFRKR